MTVRAYTPQDFETVRGWAAARGMELLPQVLSSNGFLVEDEHGPCAVVWVYLFFEVPVAALDNFYARPGIGTALLPAWRKLWRCATGFLRNLRTEEGPLGYRVIRTFCSAELAPAMRRAGWQVSERLTTQIIHAL